MTGACPVTCDPGLVYGDELVRKEQQIQQQRREEQNARKPVTALSRYDPQRGVYIFQFAIES